MILFKWYKGRMYWAIVPWRGWCRIGLHFLMVNFMCDGYTCACKRNFLWNEQIR